MKANQDSGQRATLLAFGRLLKRLRMAADLTQEELAERAMVSARSISDLERGSSHRPRRDTVQLLADGLRLRGDDRETFIALARGRSPAASLETAEAAPARYALPHPPTPIVGRLKETAAATALILDPDVRLLTLTGPGGVGKTRLALEVAFRALDAVPDGAVFVDLAPVRDAELVLSAIAHALGVQANPGLSLREAVYAELQEKRRLLILDNFEHVPAAAVAVADLLAACPSLTVLVTSRTPLRVRAEREYAVGPLALPDPDRPAALDEMAQVPAVALFVSRAEAADRKFALNAGNVRDVAEIVIRLDGLPLAIELAANRMKILSPASLLARMEQRLPLLTRGAHDLPIRQQAMRATLDWSHDLLSRDERRLFRRLAVFAGGCTVDAAEWVADAGCPDAGNGAAPPVTAGRRVTGPLVIDLLADLVDKSLLLTQEDLGGDHRFGMLETIREYGLERLEAAGEENDVRRSHVLWCLDLAERAEPELIGADQQRWHDRLSIEHDNLRTALGWALAQDDADAALRFGAALYRFWANQGHSEEGARWLERALALADGQISEPRAHSLIGAGVMAWFRGDYDRAETFWKDALALFRELGNLTGVAYSFGNLGLAADARGDYEGATASYEEALRLFRQLDDRTHIAYMLHNLGLIAHFQEDYERATTLYEEALALEREQGHQTSVAMTLGNLGLMAFAQGDYARARALQEDALALWPFVTNKPWLARGIENFALVAAATNEPERAARLFGASAGLRVRFGATLPPNDQAFNQRYIAEVQKQISPDAFAAAWAEGEAMDLEEAIDFALAGVLR